MKFKLEIELGNEGMRFYEDLYGAIRQVPHMLADYRWEEEPKPDGTHSIIDRNGNTVGLWSVTD